MIEQPELHLETDMNRMNADIGLPLEWRNCAVDWAMGNDAVCELWLFGSRSKGLATAASDVDLGIALFPASGDHDWALGSYAALKEEWREALQVIVGCHVSLVAMLPGNAGDTEIRKTGKCLWLRR